MRRTRKVLPRADRAGFAGRASTKQRTARRNFYGKRVTEFVICIVFSEVFLPAQVYPPLCCVSVCTVTVYK